MTMIQFATTSRQAVFMPITHKFQTSTIGYYPKAVSLEDGPTMVLPGFPLSAGRTRSPSALRQHYWPALLDCPRGDSCYDPLRHLAQGGAKVEFDAARDDKIFLFSQLSAETGLGNRFR